ncbi:MAG: type II secretion system F family protein [Candidatus Omnitrophica bacterium]|nr:type II secretion system F family protein [Candidatus Omnitrophota bacterium]
MLLIILLLVFATVTLVWYQLIPSIYTRTNIIKERRQQKLSNNMEKLMSRTDARKLSNVFITAPLILAAGFFFIFPAEFRFFGLVFGFILGFIFPGVYVQMLTKKSREKFDGQLVDALMIMSSSFRGGLSLVQAMEAVEQEMPDPIRKEFGIVLGENKMGVSLEEALNHLYNRMPSIALQQMITAILLARETGGNLPVIFNRIVTNIRESRKIQQNLDTLTVQGKIQGVVLTVLPIGFGFIIFSTNPEMFTNMFVSKVGRSMLIYAAGSWTVGAFMVWKISTFKDF